MSRDSFFVPGAEGFCGRLCLRGRPSFRGRVCLRAAPSFRGRVRLRAGTSDRCAPAVLSLPPLRCGPLTVHEATGGYAVRSPCPSGVPRPRHNAVLSWAGGIASVLTSVLQRLPILGLKSRIAARKWPECTPWLQRLPSLGLKSRITAVPSRRQVEWPACSRCLPQR